MRLGVAAALAALPLASAAAAPARDAAPADSGRAVYATTGSGPDRILTRRDPVSLAQIGPALALDESASPAAFSPDGTLLAFVSWTADVPALRFVDVRALRPAGAVELPRTGTEEVWWTGARRVLVLAEQPDGLRVLVVDAAAARVERSTRLPDTHFGDRRAGSVTRAGTAVLLGPAGGAARMAIVGPAGSVRVVRLVRIRAGGSGPDQRRPALAVDAARSRAFVLGGLDDPVAEIDLRTRRVSYHRLRGPAALPGTTGVDRTAVWLGARRFALVGWDENAATTRRLGLTVVDTATWRVRSLDPEADFVWVASGLVLGQRADGTVAAFSLGGVPRFTVGDPWQRPVMPVLGNGRYLYLGGLPDGRTLVVDAASGREVGRPYVEGLGELLSPPR